jgi:hypothetical protein
MKVDRKNAKIFLGTILTVFILANILTLFYYEERLDPNGGDKYDLKDDGIHIFRQLLTPAVQVVDAVKYFKTIGYWISILGKY